MICLTFFILHLILCLSYGRGKWNGLGPSIAKKTIEAHEGKIYARSEGIGKITVLVLELPLSKN